MQPWFTANIFLFLSIDIFQNNVSTDQYRTTILWAQVYVSLGGLQCNRYLQIVHGFTVLVLTRQVEDYTFLRGSNYFKMMLPVAYNYQLIISYISKIYLR